MTSLDKTPTRRLAALACLLLLGCPGDGPRERPAPSSPLVELPPPLVGDGRPARDPQPPRWDPADRELPDPAQEPSFPWLRLLVSQDNRAELEACGCPGAPTGGMPRRAAYLEAMRALAPEVVVVEGPSALSAALQGYERIEGGHRARARTVLESLAATAPAAFFPGQADFEILGAERLGAEAARLGLPLVASNLDPSLELPGTADHLLVEAKGRRVLLLGLVGAPRNERQRTSLPLVDASAAASRLVSAHAPLDLVVALTDAEQRELDRWRSASLNVDVLFVPPATDKSERRVVLEDGRVVVRVDPLGRSLSRLDVAFAPRVGRGRSDREDARWALLRAAAAENRWLVARLAAGNPELDPEEREAQRAGEAGHKYRRGEGLKGVQGVEEGHVVAVSDVILVPEIPEDPVLRAALDAYNEEALGTMAKVAEAAPEPSGGGRYLGGDACTDCHPAVSAHWARSPHAAAWRALVDAGQTLNPECLRCHTTGFGRAGGFSDPRQAPGLLNVRCEACHGPMERHVREVESRRVKPDPGRTVDEALCRSCHDEANSPAFDYAGYLERVRHPRGAPAGPVP